MSKQKSRKIKAVSSPLLFSWPDAHPTCNQRTTRADSAAKNKKIN